MWLKNWLINIFFQNLVNDYIKHRLNKNCDDIKELKGHIDALYNSSKKNEKKLKRIAYECNIDLSKEYKLGAFYQLMDKIAKFADKHKIKFMYISFIMYICLSLYNIFIKGEYIVLYSFNILAIMLVLLISYYKIQFNIPIVITNISKKFEIPYLLITDFLIIFSLVYMYVLASEQIITSTQGLIRNILNYWSLKKSNGNNLFDFDNHKSMMTTIFFITYILLLYPIKMLMISFLQLRDIKWSHYQPSIGFIYHILGFCMLIIFKMLIENDDPTDNLSIEDKIKGQEYGKGIYWKLMIIYMIIVRVELLWAEYKIDKNRVENLNQKD